MTAPDSKQAPAQVRLAPFDPIQVCLVGFIFTPIGTAVIVGTNWLRLGKPSRLWQTILISIIFLLLMTFVYGVATTTHPDIGVNEFLLVVLGSNLIFALMMTQWQRRAYQEWKAAYGTSEPTLNQRGGCRSIFMMIALSLVFIGIYGVAIAPVIANRFMLPLITTAQTPQTYDDSSFTLTYPGIWVAADLQRIDYETCFQGECLLVLKRFSSNEARLAVVRVTDPAVTTLSLEQVENRFLEHVQAHYQDVRADKSVSLKLDGKPAIQQIIFRKDDESSRQIQEIITLIELEKGQFIRFEAVANLSISVQLFKDFQDIIDSIQFN